MPANHLYLLGIGTDPDKIASLKSQFSNSDWALHFANDYRLAAQALAALKPQGKVLIFDITTVEFSRNLNALAELEMGEEVLASATPYFLFDIEPLRYFYWKHYPRTYNKPMYLDASLLFGKAEKLTTLIRQVYQEYGDNTYSFLGLMNRFFADSLLKVTSAKVSLKLDIDQEFLGSTRWSSKQKIRTHWIYSHLFAQYDAGSIYRLNIAKKNDQFTHLNLGSEPVAVATHHWRALNEKESTQPAWQAWKDFYQVAKINKWNLRKEKIFRFKENKSKQLAQATSQMLDRLERKEPLSFAHYNDGELTFIRDFLNEDHNEKWFGRQQQKYDPLLAERLHDAMQFQKEGYFVGTPCHKDHQKLAKLADEIVGTYNHQIPAMSLHHNLAFMPRFLKALSRRNVYYFTNEYQDLSFFKTYGLTVEDDKVTVVPFKNSYLEYDTYKDRKFPKDAVVVLTCGMLAKILTKIWYEQHDRLTILAFGSSLDDHIQKENINFELFPEGLPLTKNIHPSRAFLFGYKKQCSECYDF